MMHSSIVFKEVSKSFYRRDESPQVVLDQISFTIPAGKTTIIAGGSGQGKSVTLKLILRLLDVDRGSILVDDMDITGIRGKRLQALRQRFGVLFQGAALFDSLNVFDNVALPLRERSTKSEDEIVEMVTKTLQELDLGGHEAKFPAQLSGGMQKRVGLARALQLQPEIMLFDEPTTGLDPVMTHDIYELFVRTQKKRGYTSIIVSHDIPKVFNLADQIIVLQDGKIDVFGSPDEIQWSEKPHIQEFVKTTMGEVYQSNLVE